MSKMKSVKSLLVGLLLLLVIPFQAASAAGEKATFVIVNYQRVVFPDNVDPYLVKGVTMVPVRGVFEKMNAEVTWKKNAQKQIEVTAKHFGDVVFMTVGKKEAVVNGKTVSLDSPPELKSNRVSVPLRFISEAFGAGVKWVPASYSGHAYNYIRIDGQFRYPAGEQTLEMTSHSTGFGDPIDIKSFPIVVTNSKFKITIYNISNSYTLYNAPDSYSLKASATKDGDPDFDGLTKYGAKNSGLIRIDAEIEALSEDGFQLDEMTRGKNIFSVTSKVTDSANMTVDVPSEIANGRFGPTMVEGFLKAQLLKKGEKARGVVTLEIYNAGTPQNVKIDLNGNDTTGVSLKFPTVKP
ncbi:copper amine oxidase N-terminal domain-containing protein [Cohnella sp. GCM10020058]|uniref:copper amine oxidase N-terminal domain-containing protein n=1 Tax=Cohnella sp. GCM10020058 TaxID=3317330 RepID=UPI00362D4033